MLGDFSFQQRHCGTFAGLSPADSVSRPEELLDSAHRFVGSTPSIIQERGANIAGRVYKREAECLEWLRHHGGQNQPWLALDDYPVDFRGLNLYAVDRCTGLTEADVAAIIQRING